MDDDRWLRPDARRVLRFGAMVLAGVWLLSAGFTAYAAIWWPAHGILKNSLAEWFGGMTVLSLIFAAPMAFSWLGDRFVAWQVGPAGIAVYHAGRLRRLVAWEEVVALRVRPFGVLARLGTTPFEERLHWPAANDSSWLRSYARCHLGERVK